MDTQEILMQFKNGEMSLEEAEAYLKRQPFEDMGYAKLDSHRKLRSGFAEVIFCSGKADAHLKEIFRHLYEEEGEVLGTRASLSQYELIKKEFPQVQYDEISHILKIEKEGKKRIGRIAVCTAGTADIPVAEEAAQTAEYFGSNVDRIYDVGVSGIHRLMSRLDVIQRRQLRGCGGGDGRGAGQRHRRAGEQSGAGRAHLDRLRRQYARLSALLTMINSCANGIAVLNIDNGYGAGYMATQINRLAVRQGDGV